MADPVLEALNRAAEELSPADIDNVIAYLRRTKKSSDSGAKPKKEGADVDLTKILKISAEPVERRRG